MHHRWRRARRKQSTRACRCPIRCCRPPWTRRWRVNCRHRLLRRGGTWRVSGTGRWRAERGRRRGAARERELDRRATGAFGAGGGARTGDLRRLPMSTSSPRSGCSGSAASPRPTFAPSSPPPSRSPRSTAPRRRLSTSFRRGSAPRALPADHRQQAWSSVHAARASRRSSGRHSFPLSSTSRQRRRVARQRHPD